MSATIFHNPFRPTAGAEPPRIIGRDDIALEFTESLNSGIGAPARLMRVAGPRGSGKLFCSVILEIVHESLAGRRLLFLLVPTYCWT